MAHWPAADFLRYSLHEDGVFPVWRETTMAGQPFAANPLNKTAYPLQWLVYFVPPAPFMNLMIALHLFIAGWGMWRWVRLLDLRPEAAAFSALAYMLAPRIIAHMGAGHLDIVYAMAWWPWLMVSVARSVRETGWSNALRMGLFASLLFLSDVRVSLFAFGVAAVYALWSLGWKWEAAAARPRIGRFLLAAVLFMLLTASVTVPLMSWSNYLNRNNLTLADAGVFPLEAGHFLGLVLAAPGVLQEQLTYVGLTVLALAGIGWLSLPRRARWLWLLGLGLVALYALGPNAPLWPIIAPFLLWFRVPGRAWLIVAFLLPVLAGYGLNRLLVLVDLIRTGSRPREVGRLRLLALIGVVGALACGGFALLALGSALSPTVGLRVLLIGLATGVVILLSLAGKLPTRVLALLFLVLTFADLAWFGSSVAEWRGDDEWLDPFGPLAVRLLEEEPARIYSPAYSIPNQVAQSYGLRLFGGVDPFQLTGVVEAIEQGSGVHADGYSIAQPPLLGVVGDDLSQVNINAVPDTDILAQWHVSHVVAPYPIENQQLELVDTIDVVGEPTFVYANLDYEGDADSVPVPDWPLNWPALPDVAAVARLNELTVITALISAISFIVCAGLILWTRRGSHNPSESE
ncbi:MAG: hypothetical protein H7175_27920 [Burkholderiales bacterium]|nr:hypothetical protein [Anaerolineae bacterium]